MPASGCDPPILKEDAVVELPFGPSALKSADQVRVAFIAPTNQRKPEVIVNQGSHVE